MTIKYESFNQYGHPLEAEFPHSIEDAHNWTEHYYFWFYDPSVSYGLYVHMGRLLSSPQVWRSVIQVYLPEQQFLCNTILRRGEHPIGVGGDTFKVNCIEPHRSWSVHYDGVGMRATRQELMKGPIGNRPVEPIRLSLLFDGAAPNFGKPVWGDGGTAKFHTEQICKVRGHIVHDGSIIHVDGVGARDHSSGPRDYSKVIGDLWFQCLFEDGDAIMVQVVEFASLGVQAAYYYKAGSPGIEELEVLEHPTVASAERSTRSLARDPLADHDSEFLIRLRRASGEEILLECTLLTAGAVTLSYPMEENHGTDRGEGLQMNECAARVQWGDRIGYANRERTTRLDFLAS